MTDHYTAKCPVCGGALEIDAYNEVGDEIICYHCDTALEIAEIDPPRLKTVKRHVLDENDDDEPDEDEYYNDEENQDY